MFAFRHHRSRRLGTRDAVAVVAVALLFLVALAALLYVPPRRPANTMIWGVTYSASRATELGLDPQTAYTTMLDELRPGKVRLVSYWDQNEPAPGQWNFAELDFQVREAEARSIPYVIVIGRRTVRWPECYEPEWTKSLPENQQQERLYDYLRFVVKRYKSGSNLAMWQVENETNVGVFGICPSFSAKYLDDEISLVRSLSYQPILITGGGETLPLGLRLSGLGDYFGTSLYRSTSFGDQLVPKPIPPAFYTLRAGTVQLLHPNLRGVLISELQGEPWVSGDFGSKDKNYFDRTMSHDQFTANIRLAQQTQLGEAWWWGVEWWLYEKQHGDPFYWDTARDLFARSVR